MEVDAIAANATLLKTIALQNDMSMAVCQKIVDLQKANGDMLVQMMQQALGVGQNINIVA